MPNRIDDFVPWRLLMYVEARLKHISTALGYNCDPFVTDDLLIANASQAKHTVFFEATPSDGVESFVGDGRMNQRQTFNIVAISEYETEHPRRLAMSLEQDIRTVFQSDAKNIRDAVGRGCSFRFGRCTHDGGVLAPTKEAGFELGLEFTWSQKSDW